MGKKYIVEIGRLERLYKASISAKGMPNMTWLSPEVDLTPYTEPDLEQVKKETYDDGYSDGYDAGLDDAWKAARKIADMPYKDGEKIFGVSGWHIIEKRTVDEVIEKLKAYEQKQEEFHVGDEVEFDDGDTAIWMCDNPNEDAAYLMFSDGSCGSHYNSEIVRKTGRHFPEIAAVLKKMRGDNND